MAMCKLINNSSRVLFLPFLFVYVLVQSLGINSHPGNKTFRKWVNERKEAYNLAKSKQEKARVSIQVIDLVKSQRPPGRFLSRDESAAGATTLSASYWVEIDLNKAISKTSQALREGAPVIRAQHALEEQHPQGKPQPPQQQRTSLTRKRSLPSHPGSKKHMGVEVTMTNNAFQQQRAEKPDQIERSSKAIPSRPLVSDQTASSINSGSTLMPPPPPVKSSTIAQRLYGSQNAANVMAMNAQKSERDGITHHLIRNPETTPPLIPVPSSNTNHLNFSLDNPVFELPFSDLDFYDPTFSNHNYNSNITNSSTSKELQRAHSLATSDFIGVEELLNTEDETFQDPFEDDMLDISVSAEGNPITSAVHRRNSFGLNGFFEGVTNHGSSNLSDGPHGRNNDASRGSNTAVRHPAAIVKSLSSNLSHLSSMSLSKASPLSQRLFGNVSNSSGTTPMA